MFSGTKWDGTNVILAALLLLLLTALIILLFKRGREVAKVPAEEVPVRVADISIPIPLPPVTESSVEAAAVAAVGENPVLEEKHPPPIIVVSQPPSPDMAKPVYPVAAA